jgi:AraC-like DNA-binding protein
MINQITREITPLTPNDCFTIFSGVKQKFDLPLHYHEEYELNLLLQAKGSKRIIGGHMEVIDDVELVLIGPNLYHTWVAHQCQAEQYTEVTIQFHKDLLDENFLNRNQLNFMKSMLQRSQLGILFSKETAQALLVRLLSLDKKHGFESVLELFSILHALSISPGMRTLSDPAFNDEKFNYSSHRIEKVFEYMNNNYHKQVSLAEVSRIANMPEASFSRFIKRRTGKTFIDSLNEIRLGHAARMLIDTTNTVAEIAYKCGFNNISNFNRVFKRKKLCIPKEFRETYTGSRVFI